MADRGPEAVSIRRRWRNGPNAPEFLRPGFVALGGWVLADTPGGRDALRELVDPTLRDIVDELSPTDSRLALSYAGPGTGLQGTQVHVMVTAVRVHDATGRLAGTVLIIKPLAGMAILATLAASESAAARACIAAARALRGEVADVAARGGLAAENVVLRFGLHWGATLYVGQIATRGRAETTALGDEVNEAARIEACATGVRALASKSLVERLNRDDAGALGLDPDHVTYTRLADLVTATDKARRDAPAIAVCEI